MDTNFKLPSWSARNPLGIIALFISLIYGMSAVLLGVSIGNLEDFNETVLVVFIVVLPFTVLAVFGWLVVNHHKKLYGPGDFQSDQAFLDADPIGDPGSLGERLGREVEEEEVVDSEGEPFEPSGAPTADTVAVAPEGVAEIALGSADELSMSQRRFRLMARAYIAESLVFQELQNELGGSVQREVRVGKSSRSLGRVDGIVRTDKGTTIVEVMIVRHPGAIRNTLNKRQEQMIRYLTDLKEEGIDNSKIILALVIDDEKFNKERMKETIAREREKFCKETELRIYYYKELLKKYGFVP